jgi:hypothetical protein
MQHGNEEKELESGILFTTDRLPGRLKEKICYFYLLSVYSMLLSVVHKTASKTG